MSNSTPDIIDIKKIMGMLPHRYPFLLVDRVEDIKPGESIRAYKNVTMNEPFFPGHFPGNPVMPGVLQVEAMAQTGGILVLNTVDEPDQYWTYFLSIESCRFRKMVKPGDTLVFKCELLAPIKRGIAKMKGQAWAGNQLATEATMIASIVRKDS